MPLRSVALLGLLLAALPAGAQPATLVGRVTDTAGAPLPGANVYLSGTTRGTATDAEGRFRIERVELGAYRLVASLLGFTAGTRDVRLTEPGEAGPFGFELAETTLELGTVRVEARADPRHARRVDRLREAVLGETENASTARVENPADVRFTERGDVLRADAAAPLVILNPALGYRLHFDLRALEASARRVQLQGDERFQPLVPADSAQARTWRAARARAYRGSLRHLLQALASGRALADGFAFTLHPDGTDARGRPFPARPVHPTEIFRPAAYPRGWFELRADGRLEVVYTGEVAPRGPDDARQVSTLRTHGGALVDARGALADDASLTATGRFAAERLADLVPLDYRPPERRARAR